MAQRITRKSVAYAVDNLKDAMRKAGIQRTVSMWNGESVTLTADDVHFQSGSPTYGNAWRIYYVAPVGGGHYEMPWSDYLGWSGAEALSTVRALTSGIYAALAAQEVAA